MAEGRTLTNGAYVIVDPKSGGSDIFIERSEIQALRKAVAIGATIKFVKWGQNIHDAADTADTKPTTRKPRTPKAVEPVAAPTPEVEATPTPEAIVAEVEAEAAAAASVAPAPSTSVFTDPPATQASDF